MTTLRLLYHLLRADLLASAYLPERDACGGHRANGYVRRDRAAGGAR